MVEMTLHNQYKMIISLFKTICDRKNIHIYKAIDRKNQP